MLNEPPFRELSGNVMNEPLCLLKSISNLIQKMNPQKNENRIDKYNLLKYEISGENT